MRRRPTVWSPLSWALLLLLLVCAGRTLFKVETCGSGCNIAVYCEYRKCVDIRVHIIKTLCTTLWKKCVLRVRFLTFSVSSSRWNCRFIQTFCLLLCISSSSNLLINSASGFHRSKVLFQTEDANVILEREREREREKVVVYGISTATVFSALLGQ